MVRQPEPGAELLRAWALVLADAGFDADDAHLFLLPGAQSATGYRAMMWPPGKWVFGDTEDEVELPHHAAADSEALQCKVRVEFWTENRSLEGATAILRHELEHAVQVRDSASNLDCLYERAVEVAADYGRAHPEEGDPYQAIPMERDANATASRFVRQAYGDHVIDALVAAGDPDIAALRRQEPPQPVCTLERRMKDFILAARRDPESGLTGKC